MQSLFLNPLRTLLLFSIFIYRISGRALFQLIQIFGGLAPQCKFPETCGCYSIRVLKEEKSFFIALKLIFFRLLSCGPWFSSLRFGTSQRKSFNNSVRAYHCPDKR